MRRRHDNVRVLDVKYEAHFAELCEAGWLRMADQVRDSHRADIRPGLDYGALFDTLKITATLSCPVRQSMLAALHSGGRDVARAQLLHDGPQLTLGPPQGLPFGCCEEHIALAV